ARWTYRRSQARVLARHGAPEPGAVLHHRSAELRAGVADVLDRVAASGPQLAHVVGDVDRLAVAELDEALVVGVIEARESGELVAAAAGDEVHLDPRALLRSVGA